MGAVVCDLVRGFVYWGRGNGDGQKPRTRGLFPFREDDCSPSSDIWGSVPPGVVCPRECDESGARGPRTHSRYNFWRVLVRAVMVEPWQYPGHRIGYSQDGHK